MRDLSIAIACVLSACASTPRSDPPPQVISETGTKQLYGSHHAVSAYRSVFPNISKEEAFYRMITHGKVIRETAPCIRKQDGFAGQVIVHMPIYEVRNYFKGDSKNKLSNCTLDPLFIAIDTQYGLADLEREKQIAEAKLATAGIEAFITLKPYGHLANSSPPYGPDFISMDGHVLVSVKEKDIGPAKAILKPLSLQSTYIRRLFDHTDEILVTGE